MDNRQLGTRVRAAREAAEKTVRATAEAVGIDHSAYIKAEAGTRAFKAVELVALADYLEMPLDSLVRRPTGAQVESLRRASAAAERAGAEVASWVEAVNRAVAAHLSDPSIPARAQATEELRAELRERFLTLLAGLMPEPRAVAVLPGMTGLFAELLRTELPNRIRLVEALPEGAEEPQTAPGE